MIYPAKELILKPINWRSLIKKPLRNPLYIYSLL
jgi:hypothetical protein